MLDFVPVYARKMPIIAQFWRKEREKYAKKEGNAPDFSNAYWSPPLTAEKVFDIEKGQINQAGLDAIVSITDHDSIDGNLKLNTETENRGRHPSRSNGPFRLNTATFIVGVHNLPKDNAVELTKDSSQLHIYPRKSFK
jgi:hypothetical protein